MTLELLSHAVLIQGSAYVSASAPYFEPPVSVENRLPSSRPAGNTYPGPDQLPPCRRVGIDPHGAMGPVRVNMSKQVLTQPRVRNNGVGGTPVLHYLSQLVSVHFIMCCHIPPVSVLGPCRCHTADHLLIGVENQDRVARNYQLPTGRHRDIVCKLRGRVSFFYHRMSLHCGIFPQYWNIGESIWMLVRNHSVVAIDSRADELIRTDQIQLKCWGSTVHRFESGSTPVLGGQCCLDAVPGCRRVDERMALTGHYTGVFQSRACPHYGRSGIHPDLCVLVRINSSTSQAASHKC